jgi:hypothetical protein
MSEELKRVSEIVRERVLAARPHPSLVEKPSKIRDLRENDPESLIFGPRGGFSG